MWNFIFLHCLCWEEESDQWLLFLQVLQKSWRKVVLQDMQTVFGFTVCWDFLTYGIIFLRKDGDGWGCIALFRKKRLIFISEWTITPVRNSRVSRYAISCVQSRWDDAVILDWHVVKESVTPRPLPWYISLLCSSTLPLEWCWVSV